MHNSDYYSGNVCVVPVVPKVTFSNKHNLYHLICHVSSRTNILGAFKGFCTGWNNGRSIQTSQVSISESISNDSSGSDHHPQAMGNEQSGQLEQQQEDHGVPILVIMRQHRPVTEI